MCMPIMCVDFKICLYSSSKYTQYKYYPKNLLLVHRFQKFQIMQP